MKRGVEDRIKTDLDQKMVLLSGPRQVGKTTLAKALYPGNSEYFNMDSVEHRLLIQKQAWRRDCDLVIFDELHKVRKWKNWIKGIFDTEGVRPRLLVTGSSRLDVYRKGGDSLAGRFYSYRLHPFSVAEVKEKYTADAALEHIMRFGGFPEPFLKGSEEDAKRWRRSHVDRILREDCDLKPRSPYAVTKKMAEEFLLTKYRDRTTILRFAPVYSKSFLLNINRRIKINSLFYKVGGGNQKLSLLNIKNIPVVIERIVEDRLPPGIYNLADDRIYTYSNLLKHFGISNCIRIPRFLFMTLFLFAKISGKYQLEENTIKLLTDNTYPIDKIKKIIDIPYTIDEIAE